MVLETLIRPESEAHEDLSPLFIRDFNLCIIRFAEMIGQSRTIDILLSEAKKDNIEAGYALEALNDYSSRRPKAFARPVSVENLSKREIGALINHLTQKLKDLKDLQVRLRSLHRKERDYFRLLLNEASREFVSVNSLAEVLRVKHNSFGRWLSGENFPHVDKRLQLKEQLIDILDITITMLESQLELVSILASHLDETIESLIKEHMTPLAKLVQLVRG